MILLNGVCVDSCPEKYFKGHLSESSEPYPKRSNIASSENSGSGLICVPCHYSCRRCNGSSDYQCLECYEDAKLYELNPLESYCYPQYVVHQMHNSSLYFQVYSLLVVVLTCIIALILAFLLSRFCCSDRSYKKKVHKDTLQKIRSLDSE